MTLPQNQHDAAKFDRLEKGKKLKEKNISGKCTQHSHTHEERGSIRRRVGEAQTGARVVKCAVYFQRQFLRLEIN